MRTEERSPPTGRPAGEPWDDEGLLEEARRVVRTEAASVAALEDRIDGGFLSAVELIGDAPGRVLCAGIGKSGIIARKIASTLTSTGTPATFLHPVEALHGDLGVVSRDDVAILVSKSGDSTELTGLIEYFGRLGVGIVALTARDDSTLARHATVLLDCSVDEEACPMDLAPTSSTTAALAMGDALAVALFRKSGFREEDFARIHPGGALGTKLTLRVRDVMIDDDYPFLRKSARMKDGIILLAEKRGTVPIVDDAFTVVGVITAGDLTRLMEREEAFLDVPVTEVMTRDPKLARPDELGSAAVHRMEEHGVMALPVVDGDGVLGGIVHLHDLMKAGAV